MHEVIPYPTPKFNSSTNSVAILILGLSFLIPANINFLAIILWLLLEVLTNRK